MVIPLFLPWQRPPSSSCVWACMDDKKELEEALHCNTSQLRSPCREPTVIVGSWELFAAVTVNMELSELQLKAREAYPCTCYRYREQALPFHGKKLIGEHCKGRGWSVSLPNLSIKYRKSQLQKEVLYAGRQCFMCTAHVSEMHVAGSAGAHLQSIALCSARTEMKPVLVKPLLWFIKYIWTNLIRACMVFLLQVPFKFSVRTVPERWGTSRSWSQYKYYQMRAC